MQEGRRTGALGRISETTDTIAGAEQPRPQDDVATAEAIIRAEESPNRRATRENEAVAAAEQITESVRWEFVRLSVAWGIATLLLATLALWNGKLAIFIAICMVLSIMLTRTEPSQAIDKWLSQLSGGLQ
jgi:hypothetical protein